MRLSPAGEDPVSCECIDQDCPHGALPGFSREEGVVQAALEHAPGRAPAAGLLREAVSPG